MQRIEGRLPDTATGRQHLAARPRLAPRGTATDQQRAATLADPHRLAARLAHLAAAGRQPEDGRRVADEAAARTVAADATRRHLVNFAQDFS